MPTTHTSPHTHIFPARRSLGRTHASRNKRPIKRASATAPLPPPAPPARLRALEWRERPRPQWRGLAVCGPGPTPLGQLGRASCAERYRVPASARVDGVPDGWVGGCGWGWVGGCWVTVSGVRGRGVRGGCGEGAGWGVLRCRLGASGQARPGVGRPHPARARARARQHPYDGRRCARAGTPGPSAGRRPVRPCAVEAGRARCRCGAERRVGPGGPCDAGASRDEGTNRPDAPPRGIPRQHTQSAPSSSSCWFIVESIN